jgi:hypothetical protein
MGMQARDVQRLRPINLVDDAGHERGGGLGPGDADIGSKGAVYREYFAVNSSQTVDKTAVDQSLPDETAPEPRTAPASGKLICISQALIVKLKKSIFQCFSSTCQHVSAICSLQFQPLILLYPSSRDEFVDIVSDAW